MITRRHLLHGAGLAGLTLAVGACAGDSADTEELHGAAAVLTLPLDGTPHTGEAASASSRIAWELMVGDEYARTTNVAMSPSSLAVTLAMLAEGATGNSLDSLDEVFGLEGDDRSAAMGALRQALGDYEELPDSVDADDPPQTPIIHQANRVVILDDASINQDFLDRLSRYYDTGATRVPREDAKADLDAWAKENTAGLVEESAIEIRALTRLITQDALLFAARWQQPFKNDDRPLSFTTAGGATADIAALQGLQPARYARGPGWEAVRLPYDDVLAMDVILPGDHVHPTEIDVETLHESIPALAVAPEELVDITMPPSDITAKRELLDPLREIGINLDELAGIFTDATAGQVVQQVRLTVTAKGTVGAALTESGIEAVSAPGAETIVVVDRPFVMRVLDTRTGWPLFLAIVNDPTPAG